MANNTYYQGKLEDAARAYKQTTGTHPDRGEVHYNLAQVYFKKLFVPEATEAMAAARSLGFAPPTPDREENRRRGYTPVVYPPLTARGHAARPAASRRDATRPWSPSRPGASSSAPRRCPSTPWSARPCCWPCS